MARVIVTALFILTGINGLLGGYAAVSRPEGPFGIPLTVLKHGPFTNFFVPGLTLMLVIGLGSLLTAFALIRRIRMHEYLVAAMSGVSMGWIVVQVYVMEEINLLHVIIFSFALVEAAYAVYLLVKDNKWPFSLV